MVTQRQIVNGRYRIESEIGHGDLGPVYRATEETSGTSFALRFITLPNPSDRESLQEAASQIAALSHPNIVPPGELEKTPDEQYFLVREFIEGMTLAQLIRQQAPLPLPRACSLAREIARALEAIHHAGLVHGDLKPENVLVTREDDGESVKVLGFGTLPLKQARFINLARLALGADGQPVFGSPEYLSPEQALGASPEALDERSDLYPLGVILYEMITGELPHKGASPLDVLLAQIFQETQPLSGRADLEVPLPVDTLLMRTLAKKRGDRPASATAIIDQLAPWEEQRARRRKPAAAAMAPAAEPLPETALAGDTAPPETVAPTPASALDGAAHNDRDGMSSSDDLADDQPPPLPPPPPAEPALPIAKPLRQVEWPEGVSFDQSQAVKSPPSHPTAGQNAAPAESGDSRGIAPANAPPEVERVSRDAFLADLPPKAKTGPAAVASPPEGPPAELDISLTKRGAGAPLELAEPVRPAATRGSLIFRDLPERKKPKKSHWALKGLGVAAIISLIILGAGAGVLYWTGRTYWFNKDFIKTRVSYYLSSGTPSNTPDTQNVSRPAPGAPATTPRGKHNTHPSAKRAGSRGTAPAGRRTLASSSSELAAKRLTERTPPTAQPPDGNTASSGPKSAVKQTSTAAPQGAVNPAPPARGNASLRRAIDAEVAAVQDAVARGDYYFDHGDYDAAIQVYERCLARFPSNSELLAQVQRAKRAKAAEAKYLH